MAGKTEATVPATDAYHVPEPQPENFETPSQYLKAFAIWEIDRREWQATSKVAKDTAAKSQHELHQRVDAQRQRGEDKYDDFETVVSSLSYTPKMQQAIIESDTGEDIAYFLGQNPAEAQRIASLSGTAQIKEIGRLEDKLKAGIVTKPKTAAPEPPPIISPGATVNDDKTYMDDSTSTEARIAESRRRKLAAMKGQ